MSFCTYCGSQIEDGSSFCTNCGAKVESSAPVQAQEPISLQEAEPVTAQPIQYTQQALYQAVPKADTGGLIAWAIITLLLCTIPGIVALCKVGSINKAQTVEAQQQAISATKTWCIVGTVLGGLLLILSLISRSMY